MTQVVKPRPQDEIFVPKRSVYRVLFIFAAFAFPMLILMNCSPPLHNPERFQETKPAGQIIIEMRNWAGLTDEQEGKIRPIIAEQVNRRHEIIRKYKGGDREAVDFLKDELKELRVNTANRLQYFLTSKQMIEYGSMQQEEDERISRRVVRQEMSPDKTGGRGPR